MFDARPVAEIREPNVRQWRKDLLDAGVSAVTVAKAYRLLKAIFNTAVDDGLIRRNPCRIKGAGQEKAPERPVLTVPQVYVLADATDERYRVLVLLAAFTSLRWVSWRRCGARTSTSRPGLSGLPGSSTSGTAAGSRSAHRSPRPVSAPWRYLS